MAGMIRAVATDFDGTIAEHDRPDPDALAALAEARSEGVKTVLATGRTMADLLVVFPDVYQSFDLVVAENGGVLAGPAGTRELAPCVDPTLDAALDGRGVPSRRGRTLLATSASHDAAVLAEIHRLGLDCQLFYNRSELMVLPAGVTKGSGLFQGLGDLRVSQHSTVAFGDAENDLDLLQHCEVGVAVAGAVDSLKAHADVVLDAPGAAGVADFVRRHVLDGVPVPPSRRWRVRLGLGDDGGAVVTSASPHNILVAGGSRSGKSFAAGLIAEQLIELGYSLLVIDPEGDYASLAALRGVLVVGGEGSLPAPEQVGQLIEHRFSSVVVDLSAHGLSSSVSYLRQLPDVIESLRHRSGLPHWVLIDEAHVPLGAEGPLRALMDPRGAGNLLVSYRPGQILSEALSQIDLLVGLHSDVPSDNDHLVTLAASLFRERAEGFKDALGECGLGRAVVVTRDAPATRCLLDPRATTHVRHWHKYTSAELPEWHRFYWRDGDDSPVGRPAANLVELHRQLGVVPPSVVEHHTRGGDLSRWVAEVIGDPTLAAALGVAEAGLVDGPHAGDVAACRSALRAAIERRYLG